MSSPRESLLEVRGLGVDYEGRAAVDEVSFEIAPGEVLGLVGESGSGKSTLARALLRLVPVVRGTVSWRGTDLLRIRGRRCAGGGAICRWSFRILWRVWIRD